MTTFNTSIGAGYSPIAGKAVPATHVLRAFNNTLALKQGDQSLDQLSLEKYAPTLGGAQNDYALPDACTLFAPVLTANAVFSGFVVGGRTKRAFIIKNPSTTYSLQVLNASTLSAAGNRVGTISANGQVLGPRGSAFVWLDTALNAWHLELIDPGMPITPTFAAGDYTASIGSWTVDAADVSLLTYQQRGPVVSVHFYVGNTDVSSTANPLKRVIPGGFTAAKSARRLMHVRDAGTLGTGVVLVQASATVIDLYVNVALGNWTITSADNTDVIGDIDIEVQ
jgi:hypothetical protein